MTRSKKLGETTTGGAAAIVVYTCPANTRTIVKSLYFLNLTGGSADISAGYISAALGDRIRIFSEHVLDNTKVGGGECWFVIEPGDQVIFVSNTAGDWRAVASGAELPIE